LNMTCFSAFSYGDDGIITTIAGSGISDPYSGLGGFSGDNGIATNAQLNIPNAMVFDTNGNLYISDSWNHRVRKVDIGGVISTVAGNGVVNGDGASSFSGDGGLAINAQLNRPMGLAIDQKGNLYIADSLNHCIRKVGTDGIISTIMGRPVANNYGILTGDFTGDGELSIKAQLKTPKDLVFDKIGNLYVADSGNQRIRKVDINGIVSTIAGSSVVITYAESKIIDGGFSGDGGLAVNAELNTPTSMVFDDNDNLYFTDSWNHRIRKIDISGRISTVAGSGDSNGYGTYRGDGELAINARFNFPRGIVFDQNNNIYIADSFNNRVRKIDTAGIVTTIAGNGVQGFSNDGEVAVNAQIDVPRDLAINKGFFYIAEGNRIRKVPLTQDSSNCDEQHAIFDPVTAIVTVPAVDVPVLDPITGATTGSLAIFKGQLKLVAGIEDFQLISDSFSYISTTDKHDKCHAEYTYADGIFNKGGSLHLPFVDVPSVMVIPPNLRVPGPTQIFDVNLRQLAINASVFHVETYKFLQVK